MITRSRLWHVYHDTTLSMRGRSVGEGKGCLLSGGWCLNPFLESLPGTRQPIDYMMRAVDAPEEYVVVWMAAEGS